MLSGIMIGVALAVLVASGLTAMAMWVAATEQGRFEDGNCIDEDGHPQRLR